MKKLAFIFVLLMGSCSQLLASSLLPDFWKVEEFNYSDGGLVLVMENMTTWRVDSDQYDKVCELMGWLSVRTEPQSKNYFFGEGAVERFFHGDRVVISKVYNGRVIIEDIDSQALLCCSLQSYPNESVRTIEKLDTKGYFVFLSDGSEWSVSWSGSWNSYKWRLGDSVIPMKKNGDYALVNFPSLDIAFPVEPIIWKEY
ncbi:MAG: hypothetical protein K1060chlam2_01347 [Chlamydiae bacterium]|nr:hypothetical protein [Chlamydiota bacterium]